MLGNIGWTLGERESPDQLMRMHIFIKQRNTDVLETRLYEVSTPTSVHYGKHLTYSEVNELVAPAPASISRSRCLVRAKRLSRCGSGCGELAGLVWAGWRGDQEHSEQGHSAGAQ